MSFTQEQRDQLRLHKAIKSRVHDGHVFNWTESAILSGEGVIGFYFDALGLPQTIHRDSIFGSHILRWESESAASSDMLEALKVLVLDSKLNAWLVENDPKALEQASQAIAKAVRG